MLFQILHISVGRLCPASLKRVVFYKAPPSDKSALIGQLTQCIVIGRTPQARVGNIMPLTLIVSFSFQSKYKKS